MKMIVANWKMGGDANLVRVVADVAAGRKDVVICPPATMLAAAMAAGLTTGAQDCSAFADGAHTGEISAAQIAATGARYVIVGHSERRAMGDDRAVIANKLAHARTAGLTPILCVSDPADAAHDAPIIAYEPLWAIGTGKTPTVAEIAAAAHAILAAHPYAIVLYGGSVSAKNAAEILATPEIGGVLIGGASLDAAQFGIIIQNNN